MNNGTVARFVIRRSGGNESTKIDGKRKMGFDCLALRRPDEGIYIRKCGRDKYSMCGVSRGGKGRKTNVMAVLPAADPCGDDDSRWPRERRPKQFKQREFY